MLGRARHRSVEISIAREAIFEAGQVFPAQLNGIVLLAVVVKDTAASHDSLLDGDMDLVFVDAAKAHMDVGEPCTSRNSQYAREPVGE